MAAEAPVVIITARIEQSAYLFIVTSPKKQPVNRAIPAHQLICGGQIRHSSMIYRSLPPIIGRCQEKSPVRSINDAETTAHGPKNAVLGPRKETDSQDFPAKNETITS